MCVVPLNLRFMLRSTPPIPVAVPVAVCAFPSYVTLYGVTLTVAVAALTVRLPVPLLAAKPEPPAKLALMLDGYEPALIPERLTPFRVARPLLSVTADPTL